MIFAFVQLAMADSFLRAGWVASNALADCHHGYYSVLMHWPCACAVRWPKEETCESQ